MVIGVEQRFGEQRANVPAAAGTRRAGRGDPADVSKLTAAIAQLKGEFPLVGR
jgi:hypothetical protein